MSIDDVASLREHLQTAVVLEHATIPAYLTALYSVKEGHNAEVCDVIRSVVMEEMLHMTLAANVLNAVGGSPSIDSADFVPEYPCPLPHSAGALQVGLLPFSRAALEMFVRIERPARPHAPPEADDYHTIGQFYEAVEEAIQRLEAEARKKGETIFTGARDRQVQPHHFYYGGGGEVVIVHDVDTALRALEEIVHQGEGFGSRHIQDGDAKLGETPEVAHYYRFNEILVGRYYRPTDTFRSGPTGGEFPVDWSAAWNVSPNSKAARYDDQPEVQAQVVAFSRGYTALLRVLHRAFNGAPDALVEAVPKMYELRYQAQALVRVPTGDGDTTVGPSFEYQLDQTR